MKNRQTVKLRTVFLVISILALLTWFNWTMFIPVLDLFRNHSLPHVLETVDAIGIRQRIPAYRNGQASGMSGGTIAVLDTKHHPETLRILQTSTGFHSSTQQTNWDFTLNVRGYEGKHWTDFPGPHYYYCSQTGEFGYGKEWCYAPPQFKAWMVTLKAGMPKPRPVRIIQGSRPSDPVVVN